MYSKFLVVPDQYLSTSLEMFELSVEYVMIATEHMYYTLIL